MRSQSSVPWVSLLVVLVVFIGACAPAAPSPTAAPAKPAAAAKPAEAAKPAAPAKAAPAGQVTLALANDAYTMDPQAREDRAERAGSDNIYEALVNRDQDMNLVPGLAEKWESRDATTWRFTLRKGIKFHNGEAFNAQAVEYSIKRIIDPKFNSEQLSYYSTITGAKAVDETTVDVITSGPDPILPSRLYWMKMVPPQHSQATDFAEKPVGTGPYKFVEFRRGELRRMTANEDYWGGSPKIKDYIIRTIPDASTRLAALQRGEVDIVSSLSPEHVGQVPKALNVAGIEFPTIRLNNKTGPLTDKRVRQAMNYAVDKEAIVKALYSGYAEVAQGQNLAKGIFGFNPNLKAYPYDPTKARQLLEQAGKVGVEVEIHGPSGIWVKDKELVEAVAGQLEKAGFKAKASVGDNKRWNDLFFEQNNQPPAIFFGSGQELFDADRSLSAYYTCKGRGSSYCNEEVSKLVDQARTEMDVKKREQLYAKALELAYDDPPYVWLVYIQDIYGVSQKLQWKPRADGKILVSTMSLP